jgi:hypothetical protein
MTSIPELERKLRRDQSATFLTENGFPTTKTQLDRHASDRTGPQYMTFGRVALYDRRELLAWANGRLKARGKSYAASAEAANAH